MSILSDNTEPCLSSRASFLCSALLSLFVVILSVGLSAVPALAAAPESVSGATTIETQEAKRLFDQGAVFVDVRTPARFKSGHIRTAVNLDLDGQFTAKELLKFADKLKPVVLYCDGVTCGRSALAADIAVKSGFAQVYYYRPGYPDWEDEGHPVEK